MLTLFSTVLAQGQVNIIPAGQQFNGLRDVTIAGLISALLTFILIITALIFFFWLVWGGIKYITSGGDKGQTEAARGQITAALIGLVIVFAAWAILNLVSLFFGIDLLRLNIPNIQGG